MRLVRHPIRVSHETIYRFAYSKDGREEAFYRHLPEHRKHRRPRGYRRYQRTNVTIIRALPTGLKKSLNVKNLAIESVT
jgi:IS30 family transposase